MTLDDGRWAPGIGDPSLLGWVTVGAYFVCALLCVWASRKRVYIVKRRRDIETNPKSIWLLLALALFALGINKQLDLQSLFTQIGRDVAIQQGWYENRSEVQAAFIAGLGITGVLLILIMSFVYRRAGSAIKLALFGFVFLLCFVMIRATSFHQMDWLLKLNISGARMNWLLELGGIWIVALAAIIVLFRRSPDEKY